MMEKSMLPIDLPHEPPRRSGWVFLAIAALVVASFATLRGNWSGLFSFESASKMVDLFASFFPLETDLRFLKKVAWATVETIAISFLGTLLALVLAIIIAVPAADMNGQAMRKLSRALLNFLRAVPELVWASMLVIAAGLGPFPGTVALALHTAGVLGRLIADALENAPGEPYAALRRNGAPAVAAFAYGTLPVVLPQIASYTLYRWENNIRAAAVLGVVGAGGLGQLLYYHLSLLQYRDTGTVLVAMILLVAIVDTASAKLNSRLAA
jgi:phosphonate transport system permease protein